MHDTLTEALDDQAQQLDAQQRAHEVAKVLSAAAGAAASIASGKAAGYNGMATAERMSDELLAVVVDAIAKVDLATLQAAAAFVRQQSRRRLESGAYANASPLSARG